MAVGLVLGLVNPISYNPKNLNTLQVMPLAFLARSDEDSEVAALWADIWGDSSSSEAASLRLYMDDILALLSQGQILCIVVIAACSSMKVDTMPIQFERYI